MKKIFFTVFSVFYFFTSFSQSVGDIRTTNNGDWTGANFELLGIEVPETWFAIPGPSSVSGNIVISHAITINSSNVNLNGSMIINSGASLNVSSSGKLNVSATGKLSGDGSLVTASISNLLIKSDLSGTGSVIANTNISGTVERYIQANTWKMFGPGTTGATSNDVFGAYLQDYDEATDAWNYITATDFPFVVGKGYAYYKTSSATVSFSGTLRSTDLPMSNLGTIGAPATGAAVVSNPFSTSVVWDGTASWNLNNIQGAIYYYVGNQWQLQSTTVTIPAQKGFVVVANNASNSFNFPASKRVHSNETFKSESKVDAYSMLLSITDDIEKTDDRFYLYYNEDATSNYDLMYDGVMLRQGESCGNLFAKTLDNKEVSALAEPLPEGTQSYPLFFSKGEADNYKIKVQDFVMDPNKELILNDLLTGASVTLSNDVEYQFVSSDQDDINRFNLFVHGTNGIEDDINFSNLNIWSTNNDIVVENKTNEIYSIMIYDVTGRLLYEKHNLDSSLNRIPMDNKTNVLVVKLISSDMVISKTIVK